MSMIYCDFCGQLHDTDFVEMQDAKYLFDDYPAWKIIFQTASYNAIWYCEAELESIMTDLNLEY